MRAEKLGPGMGSSWPALPVFALAAGLLFPAQADSQEGVVTFAKDVAPILQENCQMCHQPGGMGPMSLLTYEEVRPWARLIKDRVEKRAMPPWHVDRTVGIQEFKNDISLSDEEIRTIARWVDGGSPLGDAADLPPPVKWPDATKWVLEGQFGRAPDLIIRSTPYTIPPSGLDQWHDPIVQVTGLDRPRWIMANETRPSYPKGRAVTHHANSNISNYGVGKPYDIYPVNTGMLLSPGDDIEFNIHYFPIGEEVKDDVVEIGIWFYPDDQEPRFATAGDRSFSSYRNLVGRPAQEMVIPPHGTQITQGIHVLQQPARIHSVRGHQHLLGTGQSIEAVYPDGRVELLSKLNWKHNWHITYLYEDHVMPLLPRGTVLIITAWYDNTANNPHNPDPDQWVVHGRRTVDEMSHMWIGITYLDEDGFEYLVMERDRALKEREQLAGQE